jgi:hypothetical protein
MTQLGLLSCENVDDENKPQLPSSLQWIANNSQHLGLYYCLKIMEYPP